MRVALFSDVHGNAVALRALVAELERVGPDAAVCLGDAVQGGVEPDVVVDALESLGCPVVLGNADAFLLDPDAGAEEATEAQLAMRAWSVERLGAERLQRIREYRPTIELELGAGDSLLAFHGSPTSYDDFLLPATPEGVFRALLGDIGGATVLAGGHVHLQFLRRVGRALFVNPGSVGFGYDHEQPEDRFRLDPWAAYALVDVDGDRLEVAFRRVPFDAADVVAAVRASAAPGAEAAAARWGG